MNGSLVTLITGGSSGIGASVTRDLLGKGHRLAITGRDAGRLKRFADSLGNPAELLTLPGDASNAPDVERAVAAVLDRYGRLDVAIANAGFATRDTIADGDPAQWREMVLTNVLGPALLVRYALPALRETQGRIVLVGSVAGLIGSPGNVYGATKWAVTGLAENVRRLVTGDGVGVTLIAPGRIDTPFWDDLGGAQGTALLTADQIAQAIAWTIDQPARVDVNTVVVRPTGQQN
ncbi:SDR family oxidoreductase [Plantactinospora siamensis]|uniref:SDR family oxidoreductase n=1 Tax=Plantactinospora siamensis TaxID=555372 RepID=A0ABV6NPH3_9ACTN